MNTKWRLSSAARWGIGLTAAVFLLYGITMAPGVGPTDSGELILAAWEPGIAHAPGFPLYLLVGWLWTHLLPIGRVAWRLNLLSAASGAVAALLAYVLALYTLRAETTSGRARVAAAMAALTLAAGRTIWGWATIAEVYALNTALVAAILALVVRWTGLGGARQPARATPGRGMRRSSRKQALRPRQKGRADQAAPRSPAVLSPGISPSSNDWPLVVAAFLFGLGLGNHLTSVGLLAPAIAFWLTVRRGWRVWWSQTTLLAGLALAAGAAVYLYLPLRAASGPFLNWGNPDNWQRFWWQVTAKQYRVSLLSSPVGPQIIATAVLWWTQFTPLGLVLLGLGGWHMARRQPVLFSMLLLVIVFITLYGWAYVIEDDQDAYYLPAFLAGAVWVSWGAWFTVEWASRHWALTRSRAGVVGAGGNFPTFAVLFVLPVLALVMNWAACNRHFDTISEDYARDALAEVGQGGLVLTRDWQFYAPALYLQHVEGFRADVTVIDTELLRRGWYFALLHKADPGLMAAVAAPEQSFLALRDAWERGDIPDGDPRIAQLQSAYVSLQDALMVQAQAAGRPIHSGPNRGAAPLRESTLAGRPDLEPGVGAAWRWVPVGLTFRAFVPQGTLPALPPLEWKIAAFRQAVPTAPERKVQETRADMATLRGIYELDAKDREAARAAWETALAIDPGYEPAQSYLKQLQAEAR